MLVHGSSLQMSDILLACLYPETHLQSFALKILLQIWVTELVSLHLFVTTLRILVFLESDGGSISSH